MQLSIPKEVSDIMEKMEAAGFEIYIVGGAVRDILLGQMVDDWDYTTNATPEEILAVFPNGYYDNNFGTVGIPSEEGLDPHEITTFRTESQYTDNRRPDKVEWGKTLEEDLKRRDFTINALALRKAQGDTLNTINNFEVIDLYGGQKDLKAKLIRAVGNPNDRFAEDALRMMRAIRIASQIGFTIEEKTVQALKDNVLLIERIARERVRDELLKIMASPHPADGVLLLKDTGLLKLILPELEKTFGVDQKSPNRHHIYDVGTHSIKALESCRTPDPVVRFATLIHDIGKPITFKKSEDGMITFYNHEVVGAAIARRIAERLRFSKKDSERLYKMVRWHQFTVDENQTDSAIRRFISHVGKENLTDMLFLRVADRIGGGARETSWRLEEYKQRLIEVQKQPFTVRDLKINGLDVMKELNIEPSRRVGEILNELFKEVEAHTIDNTREVLLKKLQEYK